MLFFFAFYVYKRKTRPRENDEWATKIAVGHVNKSELLISRVRHGHKYVLVSTVIDRVATQSTMIPPEKNKIY